MTDNRVMATWTQTQERVRITDHFWIRAPHLGRLVDVLFVLREKPEDKRARIQLGFLAHDGVDRCVNCQNPLSLDGYAETRTEFSERQTLTCSVCGTRFLLAERQIA